MDRIYEQKYKQLNTKRTKASEAREKRQPFCLFCYFIQKKKNLPFDHQRRGKNRWKINYAKKDKLTLHADFVLSSARVRDEIHLHRHLPHRAVRWLTWTSTKKGNWKKSKWNSAKRDGGGGGWWKCHPAIVKDQDRMERRHQSAERQKLGQSVHLKDGTLN